MKIFALVALLLLCCYFVAGEQQHGLALRGHALPRSPIRRLNSATCPDGRPGDKTALLVVDDFITLGASAEYDTTNIIDGSTDVFVLGALDCSEDKLYLGLLPFITSQDYSLFDLTVSFSGAGVVANKQIPPLTTPFSGVEVDISLDSLDSCCQTVGIALSNSTESFEVGSYQLDLSCPGDPPCGDQSSAPSATPSSAPSALPSAVPSAAPIAAFGDPHLKTWNGDIYNFDGGCDLIFLKNRAFASKTGLEIHIRTTIRRDWSYISAAALKIGDDVLEVRSGATHYLNGAEGAELVQSSLAGFPITTKAHGQKRHMFKVALGNECEVIIKVYNEFLAVSVNNAGSDFEHSVGMMGSYRTGRRLARDGETEIDDPTLFGFEWQVREGDPVLFQKPEGPQYPQACDMPETDSAATGRNRRLSEDGMVSLEDAEKACQSWPDEGREACLYDVMSTGDLAMAEAGAF